MVIADTSLQAETRDLIERFVKEASTSNYWYYKLKDSPVGKRILKIDGEELRGLVFYLIIHMNDGSILRERQGIMFQNTLIDLLRKRIPFTHDDLVELVRWYMASTQVQHLTLNSLVTHLQRYCESAPMTRQLRENTVSLIRQLNAGYGSISLRKEIRALEKLVTDVYELPLVAGEAWSDQAIADIATLTDDRQNAWAKLLAHLQDASGSTPSVKWRKTAETLLQPLGDEVVRQALLRWFPLVDKPRTVEIEQGNHYWRSDRNHLLDDNNADILRGMAWLCSRYTDAEIARALTELALSAYRKVPNIGPRCVRVGNACIWGLGNMPGMNGVHQLVLLQAKIKFTPAQKGIEKALTIASEREGLQREEIEELSVPTYQLEIVGMRREQLGDFTAELCITGTHSVELNWFRADGKVQRTIPKQVKTEFAEELKELQQVAKDIRKMLPAQRERIDRLFLRRKVWDYPTWRERYLDHPLIGVLARRIIWRFHVDDVLTDALWYNDGWIDCYGNNIAEFDQTAQVTLWHPLDATQDAIIAWRAWLEQHEVQQPFKQAHREIYLLTDAERNSGTYSNRFAAHVLRQHQFSSLCDARGWRNKLRLMVDDTYPPAMKELPEWSLRAEFWIGGAGDTFDVDTNQAGVFLRVTTDQVRFYGVNTPFNYSDASGIIYGRESYGRGEPHEALPLDQIPPLVFSEVMRDIDLFVGVASVGNDPNWADGGPNGRYRDYWQYYAFGDLSETAKTRKAVLENLVPRLKIASQCELRDRFLVVRGKRRTYKIHLGSGNILMEPNDQYLCIVPGRGSAGDDTGPTFLPFEGDRTLAVILSKAFLLADDMSITDQSILSQIQHASA